MTITSTKLLKTGGDATASGNDPSGVNTTYNVLYQAKSNDPLDGPKVVRDHFKNTVGLPWIGDPYQFGNDQDAESICQKISPSRVTGSDIFNVQVTYEPPSGGGGREPEKVSIELETKPPLLWHDNIEITSTQISVPIRKAILRGYSRAISSPGVPVGYEGPVVNSAMDPFDPEPEGEIDIDVLRISRNVYPWSDGAVQLYRGTVNIADVLIEKPDYGFTFLIPKQQGKIHQLSGTFEVDLEYKVKYYKMVIEVHVNKLGWRLKMTDKGLRRRAYVGDTTELGVAITAANIDLFKPPLTAIHDLAGDPITVPTLLDGRGAPLTITSPTLPTVPPPVIMEWEYYKEIYWTGIPW